MLPDIVMQFTKTNVPVIHTLRLPDGIISICCYEINLLMVNRMKETVNLSGTVFTKMRNKSSILKTFQ